ncbi:MAG: serpin family protein [Bacteroidales bacterium]|nr:serpin family protein [Bacteroidales bacterium]
MKRMRLSLTLAALACAMLAAVSLVAACNELSPEGGAQGDFKPIVLTKSQQQVAARCSDFALAFFKEGYRTTGGDNIFVSPMSLTMLSCMLANGAEGDTYKEIVNTLGLKDFTIDQVNSYYSTMVNALQKADNSVNFSLANSIWPANDISVKKAFQTAMDKTYDAETFAVDFSAPSTLTKVNDWCKAKTSGLIPKMFEELSPWTRMMLINALYFKGTWTTQFPKESTCKDYFITLSGAKAEVEYMNLTAELSGHQDKEVSLVRMPYGNGAFVMEAILPTGDFNAFVTGLSMDKLSAWGKPTHQKVCLRFPKFKAEYDTDHQLVPMMKNLGVKKAFSQNAEFGKMSNENLYVSDMRQKACVIVDEEGTEAAAVTAVMQKNSVSSEGVALMDFNRPFIYLIRESSTGAILFIGAKVK